MGAISTDLTLQVDIELCNRCNADCYFCPRDATPHQGRMTPEIFEQALARTVEFRELSLSTLGHDVRVSLCGLGEPLLNSRAPEMVAAVRSAGMECHLSTNAALLDERRGGALLDAGLTRICINAGERDDAYEDIYKLPWATTRDNIIDFAKRAAGRCEVDLVLVDHRRDQAHLKAMKEYWRQHGITSFMTYDVMNRGGALFVDHMQFESLPQRAEAAQLLDEAGGDAICGAPFGYLFIGYDGNYYLCCSDWRKEAAMGSVFDRSFQDVTREKLVHVTTRMPVCQSCNLDPLNRVTDELRARDAGEPMPVSAADVAQAEVDRTTMVRGWIDALDPGANAAVKANAAPRRIIPVRAV